MYNDISATMRDSGSVNTMDHQWETNHCVSYGHVGDITDLIGQGHNPQIFETKTYCQPCNHCIQRTTYRKPPTADLIVTWPMTPRDPKTVMIFHICEVCFSV